MTRKLAVLFFLMLLVIPLICSGQSGKKASSKVSFDFMDADVRNVVRALAEVSPKNIIISDAVKGKITMKLDNVYWDDALDLVVETAGLRKIEADSAIRIVTSKEYEDDLKRKMAERDSFRKERSERQKQGEEFVTETVYLNYVNPADMERMLRGGVLLAGGGCSDSGPGVERVSLRVRDDNPGHLEQRTHYQRYERERCKHDPDREGT